MKLFRFAVIVPSVLGAVMLVSSHANAVNFDLAAGVEGMGGDTTYQIGGNIVFVDGSGGTIQFPASELEWPLDIWLGRIDAGVTINDSWRVKGTVKKNISDPDSNMKDSDWGLWYLNGVPGASPTDLDAYSESSISDFDAVIFDIDVEWTFLKREKWSLFAGLGYQYQNFDYDSNLILHTEYYQGSPIGSVIGDGSVSITYEITYDIPYFIVGGDFALTDNFSLLGSFAYGPWVNAEDEDNHVLRDRIAKGDMDGDAYMFDLAGQYNFTSSWFLMAGFHYIKIDVDGDTSISSNGVPVIRSEDEEAESNQTSGYLKVGYTF